MSKPAKAGLFLCFALGLSGVLWTIYVRRGGARGIEVAASFLPLAQWGFGANDTIQAAAFRTTPAGKLEKPRERRRLGFIEVRERFWVPLVFNSARL